MHASRSASPVHHSHNYQTNGQPISSLGNSPPRPAPPSFPHSQGSSRSPPLPTRSSTDPAPVAEMDRQARSELPKSASANGHSENGHSVARYSPRGLNTGGPSTSHALLPPNSPHSETTSGFQFEDAHASPTSTGPSSLSYHSSTTSANTALSHCSACQRPMSGQFVRALSAVFHLECFRCKVGFSS